MSPAVFPLRIRLLGPFDVRVAGRSLPRLRTRKGELLLAYLVLHSGREVERQAVAAALWPHADFEDQALASLRKCLEDLRHALGTEAWRLPANGRQKLRIDLTDATVDVIAFARLIRRQDIASLERAVTLHAQPLLEAWGDQEEERWVLGERARYEKEYVAGLKRLHQACLQAQDFSAAANYLRLLHAADIAGKKLWWELIQTSLATLQEETELDRPTPAQTDPSPALLHSMQALLASHLRAAEPRANRETAAPALGDLWPAIQWSLQDAVRSTLLSESLFRYLSTRGKQSVLREELGKLLSQPEAISDGNRAYVYNAMTRLSIPAGDYQGVEKYGRLAKELFVQQQNVRGIMSVLAWSGNAAYNQGDYARAKEVAEERLKLAQEQNSPREVAITFLGLGDVLCRLGEYDKARAFLHEALATFGPLDDVPSIVTGYSLLGYVEMTAGRHLEAQAWHRKAVRLARKLGDAGLTCATLIETGNAHLARGAFREAEAAFAKQLKSSRDWKEDHLVQGTLDWFVILEAARCQRGKSRRRCRTWASRAATLYGASQALRLEAGLTAVPQDHYPLLTHAAETAEQALGAEEYAEAWARGRKLTRQEAITFALWEDKPQRERPAATAREEETT